MAKYYLSVKTAFNTIEHFKVPYEVYLYVRQLETVIKFGGKEAIERLYPGRFTVGEREKEN